MTLNTSSIFTVAFGVELGYVVPDYTEQRRCTVHSYPSALGFKAQAQVSCLILKQGVMISAATGRLAGAAFRNQTCMAHF